MKAKKIIYSAVVPLTLMHCLNVGNDVFGLGSSEAMNKVAVASSEDTARIKNDEKKS